MLVSDLKYTVVYVINGVITSTTWESLHKACHEAELDDDGGRIILAIVPHIPDIDGTSGLADIIQRRVTVKDGKVFVDTRRSKEDYEKGKC